MGSVFGEEYLSPMKKAPAPKNTTMTVTVTETEEVGAAGEEKKKSKKDQAAEKENAAPKNAQNAHEAIRPSETDGKVL